jgi:Iap family predicted aminopeptidase
MMRGLHRLTTPALLGLCALTVTLGWGQTAPLPAAVSTPRAFLERLCDDFGGRMTGTPGNVAALDRLAEELRAMGFAPEYSRFTMPGWTRGDDRVELVEPFPRPLRVAALSYSQAHPALVAPVVSIGNGRPQDYPADDVAGRVGLLDSGTPQQISELVAAAHARGLKGILFINREGGGQLLARTGSFSGAPLPLPVYSINQEEGRWLQRLLARAVPVRVRMETRSQCREIATANLIMRIPGSSTSRIIVGAHFDGWDLGQGAMDNGIGIAQLYALAQALRGQKLFHTIELVWYNGEEQGLWGSRHEASRLGDAPIVAMVNLDMVGVPVAVNALGDESLVPVLERWHEGRAPDRRLALGVQNINWVGSDHTPYQLAGVRAVTFNAPIPRESVRFYHDLADTIDKVPATLIDDSAAIITDLVRTLAADQSLEAFRRSPSETEALFTRFNLERRLRAMGLWTYDR